MGPGKLRVGAGQVSVAGNTALITPALGKSLRVYYCSYNPKGAVEAAFRFGPTGLLFLQNNIPANSVIAKDFGDFRYLEGAVNEPCMLNLSQGVVTKWTVFYLEAP